MSNIPKAFNYSQFKPVGLAAKNRITRFRPQSSYGNIGINDTLRFQINTPGYWDPYHAYMNIDISCAATLDKYGSTELESEIFLQLDNSAASFISELVVYTKGMEVERIMDYDVISAILNDIHYSPEQRQSRLHEGMGFGNKSQPIPNYGVGPSAGFAKYNATSNYTQNGVEHQGALFKTSLGPRAIVCNPVETRGYHEVVFEYFVPITVNSGYTTSDSMLTLSLLPTSFLNEYLNSFEGILTDPKKPSSCEYERADIILYKSAGRSISRNAPTAGSQRNGIGAANITGALNGGGTFDFNVTGVNPDPTILGTNHLFDYSLSNASFEPMFSNISQINIIDGKIGQYSKITQASFSLPILSGIFGVLMPFESFRFIPMMAFENLILEFRMNKYALFTSGYVAGSQLGIGGATYTSAVKASQLSVFSSAQGVPPDQLYSITKFEIVSELVEFDTPEIDILTKSQLETGIILHTQSWFSGPYFYLANTAAANGTFQINLSFESMKALIFCFLLDDYKQYSFCRKNYRVSRNITYMQIKVGIDYYPSQPIEGHGGSPLYTSSKGTNSEFLINLYKTFGKMHDILSDNFISNVNFAVNERPYDVTDIRPYCNLDYATSATVIQNDSTSAGLPGYYENACVGRAVYGMNFETLNKDVNFISGVNTTKVTPFEISLKTDSQSVDTTRDRPATMYIFCLYDFLVNMSSTSVRVIGRG